jgi:hypothetical protein
LHLNVGGQIHVKVKNQVVEDLAELQSLGNDRIQEIVSSGSGTHEIEIDLGYGMKGRRMIDPVTQAEGEAVQKLAQSVFDSTAAAEANARDRRDRESRRQRDMLAAGVTVPPVSPMEA